MIPVSRPFNVPRDDVSWFSSVMELKLQNNDKKKSGYDESFFSQDEIIQRIKDETNETENIIENMETGKTINLTIEQLGELIKEYADIANFCMMGANQARKTVIMKREKNVLL